MSTIFPKWTNGLPFHMVGGGMTGLALVVGGVWYYFTPAYWEVGYMPKQPGGGFNHQIHAGKLGMDCRYCHSKVEESAEANIPNVAVCNGCHAENKLTRYDNAEHKAKTDFIRAAYAADESPNWHRVHKLPDYVRNFPHNAHVNAGVSCISCHGNVARMPVVWQHESLSMGWCLDCHREPEKHLVPRKGDPRPDGGVYEDMMTRLFDVEKMQENPQAMTEQGVRLYEKRKIAAPENCGACHY
ncbi:MAG TPA: cytochrome c3 family protein [Phycisphaerales bacterium]|nr:cytochrome c3 family protein [Phycisphaerales bacterium]